MNMRLILAWTKGKGGDVRVRNCTLQEASHYSGKAARLRKGNREADQNGKERIGNHTYNDFRKGKEIQVERRTKMAIQKKETESIKYEVLEKCGTISKRGNSTLELRYVAWNGREPKYDIRPWYTDDNGNEKSNKGVTLSGEELEALGKLILSMMEEE